MVLCGSLTLPLGDAGAKAAPLPARSQDYRAARRAGKRAAFRLRRAMQHAPVVGGLIVPVPPLSCRTDPTLQRGGRRPRVGVSVPRVCLESQRPTDHRGHLRAGERDRAHGPHPFPRAPVRDKNLWINGLIYIDNTHDNVL